jgi:hypothetical protein
MKKNNMIGIIGLMLVIMLIPNVLAEKGIDVSLSKYDPYPATPGQVVKIWLLVQNTGDIDAKNINVEIVPQAPFTSYNQESTQQISILGAQKDYLIDFNLKIDDNAAQGYNNLKIKYSIDNALGQEKDLEVYVQTKDATLSIESVKMNPEEISPGTDGTLTIIVKNTAPTTMTDLSMTLQLQTLIGTTIVDLPFAPMDSGTERRVYSLESGKSAEFKYNLRVYPDAISKVYKIPFTLTYYDSIGNAETKTDYVGVIVNAKPDISVIVDKTEVTQQQKIGVVTLKVINKGVNDIKFLNMNLETSEQFETLSNSNNIYIGNLVSDDYQTAEYTINVKSTENKIMIPVTLQYRDANNNYYEKKFNVDLNLIDGKKLNPQTGIAGYSWLTIIIVLVIAFFVWRYFKNKKAKNKKGQFYQ